MVYLWIGTALAAVFLIYGYCLNYFPVREDYVLEYPELEREIRLVLLTDLHACDTGQKNRKLLRAVEESRADFICIAGDMTVKNGKHTDRALSLLQTLSRLCPVYYAPGNHEIRMPDYACYRESLRKMGIHYLENERISAGGGISIVGLDLSEYWYHKCWQKREMTADVLTELLGRGTGGFSILLAHNPEYFPQYAEWGANLTLSGHIHGGMARLPLLGGVLSPSLRLFPKYDAGLFSCEGKKMLISRGLGLHHIRFRFFNRPEISVVTLYPAGKAGAKKQSGRRHGK